MKTFKDNYKYKAKDDNTEKCEDENIDNVLLNILINFFFHQISILVDADPCPESHSWWLDSYWHSWWLDIYWYS